MRRNSINIVTAMTDDQERITTAIGLDQENSSAVAVEEDEPETSLKKSPSSDLAAIKRKLSIAGLTDQVNNSGDWKYGSPIFPKYL